MNLKEIKKVVGKIQSHLFRNSNSFAIGMLKSHFKGAGLQFKEHQVYAPGDDVRFIDWKLSAKTNTTFVKTFEEERNIEIIVVLDITPSMLIGYKDVSTLQASIEVACLLYLLAEKTKDRVKVVVLTDNPTILPAFSGQEGIATLVSVLEKNKIMTSNGQVNLLYEQKGILEESKKLGLLKSFVARNKEVVLLSDFNYFSDFETINKLTYRPNMHCFKITSPIDEATNQRFSILSKVKNKKRFISTRVIKKHDEKLKGRWKKIAVEDRYLETFIREML